MPFSVFTVTSVAKLFSAPEEKDRNPVTAWRVAVLTVLVLLIGVPLFMPFLEALQSPSALRALGDVPRLAGLAKNTILLIGGTLALALPTGIVGAVLLYRTDLPLRGLLRFLVILTLFVPLPFFASAWQASLGSGGFVVRYLPALSALWSPPATGNSPAGWTAWGRGLNAAIWIHAVAALPWVVLIVGQGLTWVERSLEEEALTLVAPWRVLLGVTLRRSLAAIGAAILWVALQTATEIVVTDMFQVRTFGEEVYTQYVIPEPDATDSSGKGAEARAVAVSLPSVLATWGLVLLAARAWERRLPPLDLFAMQPHVFSLGRWRWPTLLAVGTLVVLLVGIPAESLVWKLGLSGSPEHWSLRAGLDRLGLVVRAQGRLVNDSLIVAFSSGAAIAGLALVACWLASGCRWMRTAVFVIAAAAWAVPGPVVGLGLIAVVKLIVVRDPSGVLARWLYDGPSPLPVAWAYLVRFFPCAVALLWPVVRLLPGDLRETAQTEGASPALELTRVIWPLSWVAWLRASVAVGVLAIGELSAGKLIETPGSMTFTHEVFRQMHYGATGELAALCLILLASVTVGALLVAAVGWTARRRN
jgi:iron(III) transport system permease protein